MNDTNNNDAFLIDPSHATPGVDANNPTVRKVRLDANVVGTDPAEGLKTPSADLPENRNAENRNSVLDDEELGDGSTLFKAEAPDQNANTNGTVAASDDASNAPMNEVNPDGTNAPQEVEIDEPVNNEAAEVAQDPSNVIGQNQIEAENANAQAMDDQAKAEENENDLNNDNPQSNKAAESDLNQSN